MKRLLSIGAIAFALCATSQTLESEDFNSLTIGNVGTNIALETAGQAGFFTNSTNGTTEATTSTNAANSNFQIVANAVNTTQGLQLIGPNGNEGVRQILKNGFTNSWETRTAGNEIVEAEATFNTGANTTSENALSFRLGGTDTRTATNGNPLTIGGLEYDSMTGELLGIAYLDNQATMQTGTFAFSLGANNSELIIPVNTQVRIGFSYNATNGRVRWVVSFGTVTRAAFFENPAFVVPNIIPDFSQILLFAGATNGVASTYRIDNTVVRAAATDGLLNAEEVKMDQGNVLRLFPNPVNATLNLQATNGTINTLSIYSITGALIEEVAVSNLDYSKNVSSYATGMYLVKAQMDNGSSQTIKFIKQ